MSDGVVVLGDDAVALADRVAARRAEGRRAAGFIGTPDDLPVAEATAEELFGPDAVVEFALCGEIGPSGP